MVDVITFKHALLCDDVRREDNGKLILIGLYGGNIQVASLPTTLLLALVCECITNSEGPKQNEVHIEFRLDGKVSTKGSIGVTIDGSGTSFLAFPKAPIHLANPGKLEIFITLPGQEQLLAWSGEIVTINQISAATNA